MQTVGLIGGMSWESTALYYQHINQGIQDALGGLHSAQLILISVDFAKVAQLQQQGRWQEAGVMLSNAARSLQKAGADAIVLCTNTMHKVADAIEEGITVPFLHIADATAAQIQAQGLHKVALLGTAFTMEQAFYRERLQAQGLEVLLPNETERAEIHRIIYEELCLGQVLLPSRQVYTDIMQRLVGEGAQGVILGCTEIVMLVGDVDVGVPLFDTTAIHAQQAVAFALS